MVSSKETSPAAYLASPAQKNNYALYLAGVTHNKPLMDKLNAAYKEAGSETSPPLRSLGQ